MDYEIISAPNHSESIGEQLFVQVYGAATADSKMIIGNVYRPPRERIESIDCFLTEFNNLLEWLESFSSVHIAGDYNLDLLKCQSDSRINRFLNQSFSIGFFPKLLSLQLELPNLFKH